MSANEFDGNPEENFYRVCHIVLDVIPNTLRELFKSVWDGKYPNTPWDDRPATGQRFLQMERNQNVRKTVNHYMIHGDSSQFDGTCLFSILLYSSQNFFHGKPAVKTIIDGLRKIRNGCFAHLPSASVSDNDYQHLLTDVKAIFAQLGWPITPICDIERKYLNTSQLKQLEDSLIAEDKRNKDLETQLHIVEGRIGFVEKNLNSYGEKLVSIEAKVSVTTNAAERNAEKIALLETNIAKEDRDRVSESNNGGRK